MLVMEAHPADAELQLLACQTLGQLAQHPDYLRKMSSSDVVTRALPQRIVSALKAHKVDANVVGAACALLQPLVLAPTWQTQLIGVGAAEELLGVAEHYRQDAVLQQTVLAALIHLAENSDNLARIVAAGGVEGMLGAMWAHTELLPELLPVQLVATRGLAHFADNASILHATIQRIKEGNGIEVLLKTMAIVLSSTFARDAAVQEHVSAVLEHVSAVLWHLASDPDCQCKIVADGALEHLIRAIASAPPAASQMQARACAALYTLSSHPDNQLTIGAAGGIEALVKALEQHHHNAEVQYWGVLSLTQTAGIADSRERMRAVNGIASIVKAMDALRGDTEVQYAACEALRRLAETAQGQAQIAAAGGIASIVAAMDAHSADAALQIAASGTLWTLAEESMGNAQSILEAGGVDSLAGSMDIHVANPQVQAQAARALWYLARWRPRSMARMDRYARNWKARKLEEAKGRQANGGLPSVVTWCPRLRAGRGQESQVKAGFDASIESLVAAMAMHKEPAVQYFACAALGAIAHGDDHAAHAIIKGGGIAQIARAMAEHEDRAEMQWRAGEALWSLADADSREMSSGGFCALRLADGLEDILNAMEEHRWVRSVQTFTSWALVTIATNEGRASAEVRACQAIIVNATSESEAAAEEEGDAARVRADTLAVAQSAADMECKAVEAKAQASTDAAAQAAAREQHAAAQARATVEAAMEAATKGESAAAAARAKALLAADASARAQAVAASYLRFGHSDRISRILEALDCWAFHGDTQLLNDMLTCLQRLASHADYAEQIAAAGGIDRVIDLFDKYEEEADILLTASLCLSALTGYWDGDLFVAHGDNHQKIRALEGLGKMDAVIRKCHEQHELHSEPPWYQLERYGYLVKVVMCEQEQDHLASIGVRVTAG